VTPDADYGPEESSPQNLQKHFSEEQFKKMRPPMIETFKKSVSTNKPLNRNENSRTTSAISQTLPMIVSSNFKEHQHSILSNSQDKDLNANFTKKVSFRQQYNQS
jgi:hypothetical protein